MSTHNIPVVEVTEIIPHPAADNLEIIRVKGWQCLVQRGEFKVGDYAVYIEPDYMVPVSRPEFAFLKDPNKFDQTHVRIKARRLRGLWSYGLLIKAPLLVYSNSEGYYVPVSLGDNMIDFYGIHRWEPPMNKVVAADTLSYDHWPKIAEARTKFDLENINNFPNVFDENTPVVITEKIHGANARYLFLDGEMYVGSRTRWLKRSETTDAWHYALDNTWFKLEKLAGDAYVPAIQRWCENNPGVILYGEVYGNVQDLKYGQPNHISFAAFAAFDTNTGHWIDTVPLFLDLSANNIESVPILSIHSGLHWDVVRALAEGDSVVKSAPRGHMREGVVITAYRETTHPEIGRMSLKYVSNRYITRQL